MIRNTNAMVELGIGPGLLLGFGSWSSGSSLGSFSTSFVLSSPFSLGSFSGSSDGGESGMQVLPWYVKAEGFEWRWGWVGAYVEAGYQGVSSENDVRAEWFGFDSLDLLSLMGG